jgi:hypothetical protein
VVVVTVEWLWLKLSGCGDSGVVVVSEWLW